MRKAVLILINCFLSIIMGIKVNAQEHLDDNRFGEEPVLATTVVTVDGVRLFVWNEEKKEMAVKGDDLTLWPASWGKIGLPELNRDELEGGVYSGDVVVPSYVEFNGETYTVTRIAFGAFIKCPELNSVTIPETVTTFGAEAFYGCENLSHVELPANIDYLNMNVFADCPSLKKINFKNIRIIYPMDQDFDGWFYLGGEFYFEEIILGDAAILIRYLPCLKKIYLIPGQNYASPGSDISSEQFDAVELIVPVGMGDYYRNSELWGQFAHITESDEHVTGVKDVVGLKDGFVLVGNKIEAVDTVIDIFSIAGVRVARVEPGDMTQLPAGIYIATDGLRFDKIVVR